MWVQQRDPFQIPWTASPAPIAEGPRFLLDAYAVVLARHGVDCSLIEDRPFKLYRDRGWQPLASPPELLQIGTSMVIAGEFTASR